MSQQKQQMLKHHVHYHLFPFEPKTYGADGVEFICFNDLGIVVSTTASRICSPNVSQMPTGAGWIRGRPAVTSQPGSKLQTIGLAVKRSTIRPHRPLLLNIVIFKLI